MSVSRALYPGSFDPLTYGHLDLIRRGSALFGEITVAVVENQTKSPVFTSEERVEMLKYQFRGDARVHVTNFRGLVVEYCLKNGFNVILRGLRTVSDFEFEYQMALTNRSLAPGVETVFVMPSEQYSFTSSRLIKEVLQGGGDVSRFLPPEIESRMRLKYGLRS
ncbi:MAG: pantetheine-phosphate adenylyltransferase [Planctomycetes bacterium]|nr:pantetheine-phosphate adenylyltransferase [Planctomycetota bacterium]